MVEIPESLICTEWKKKKKKVREKLWIHVENQMKEQPSLS